MCIFFAKGTLILVRIILDYLLLLCVHRAVTVPQRLIKR